MALFVRMSVVKSAVAVIAGETQLILRVQEDGGLKKRQPEISYRIPICIDEDGGRGDMYRSSCLCFGDCTSTIKGGSNKVWCEDSVGKNFVTPSRPNTEI